MKVVSGYDLEPDTLPMSSVIARFDQPAGDGCSDGQTYDETYGYGDGDGGGHGCCGYPTGDGCSEWYAYGVGALSWRATGRDSQLALRSHKGDGH